MTPASWNRLRRVFESRVGYDPAGEWPPQTCLETLQWLRTACALSPDDPTAYRGPILSRAESLSSR